MSVYLLVLAALAGDVRRPAFDPSKVWDVHITVSAKEYEAMQPRGGFSFGAPAAKPKPPKDDDPLRQLHRNTFGVDLPWARGDVTIDGSDFQGVGVRYKGNGTIGDSGKNAKKSFKIEFDHFGGAARFRGLKTVNLHSGITDPSKLRETLGYQLYRDAGVPAPRTALAEVRLTVPGTFDKQLLGVFTVVEQIDEAFLSDFFGTDKGLLMKPEGLRDFVDMGDKWERYNNTYKPRREPTKDEVARLVAFARLVQKGDDATFAKEIADRLDVDGYLRYLATTAFIANSDSFFALGHNFYLYLHPKTGKLHFFPWDVDRAFSNFPIFGSNNQQMNLSLIHPYAGPHRLTDRLMALPDVAARYQKLLAEMATTCFAKDRLLKEVELAEGRVKDLIARDLKAAAERKEVGDGFGPAAFLGRPPAMKTFVVKRTVSVAAQVAGTSKGHVPQPAGPGGFFRIADFLVGPFLEELDADKDELLAKDEWLAGAKRVFTVSDREKRGWCSQKDFTEGFNSLMPKAPEGTPPMFTLGGMLATPLVKRADADKDGKVTLAELLAAAEKIFDEFDKGKKGKLDDGSFGELLQVLFPPPNFGPPPKPAEPPKKP